MFAAILLFVDRPEVSEREKMLFTDANNLFGCRCRGSASGYLPAIIFFGCIEVGQNECVIYLFYIYFFL